MKEILQKVRLGQQILLAEYNRITTRTLQLLSKSNWGSIDIEDANSILEISNILYNNSSSDVLPLDDGIYDQLMVIIKRYNKNYKVGAIPIIMPEEAQNENKFEEKKIMCTVIDPDSKLYIRDILKQHVPINQLRGISIYNRIQEPITKRLINTTHKYPELVGTLDKCKFVLNADAISKSVYDKPGIQIFERDFIHKCINKGIINPNEIFEMVCELKYDGISIEAEVCGDTIISALSRGDTSDNIASDLSPILAGYKFPNAKDVPTDITFGIKFEAIITKRNLERLSLYRNKDYKNCRNAIIGLFGASDAYKYKDLITLVPLSTSLEMDRESELKFLNKYYNSGEYNRYIFINGDYKSILFQVKQFTESAEVVRSILPYMIDGVVISFTDKNKIKALGRENFVNKYQMAIKFIPKKVRTIFLGYTYNIGKSGDVIPMVHFKPCEFIGAIHTKQTIHSYERFKTLNLSKGEQIDIEYVNDVISYITKPDNEYNRKFKGEPEKFIEHCPYCGGEIMISKSGRSAKCINPFCHERMLMRVIDMVTKLGFKDISEESIRLLNIVSFDQLINCTLDKAYILGPKTSIQFIEYIHNLKSTPIEDWRIMSAMCFDGMADEKWKVILSNYSIQELLVLNHQDKDRLISSLTSIHGIGNAIAEAIINGFDIYKSDIDEIVKLNIISSKGKKSMPKVIMTGFRDQSFVELLAENGFEASDSGLTKTCYALVTNDKNSNSTKIQKARKYNIPIYTISEFINVHNIKIN